MRGRGDAAKERRKTGFNSSMKKEKRNKGTCRKNLKRYFGFRPRLPCCLYLLIFSFSVLLLSQLRQNASEAKKKAEKKEKEIFAAIEKIEAMLDEKYERLIEEELRKNPKRVYSANLTFYRSRKSGENREQTSTSCPPSPQTQGVLRAAVGALLQRQRLSLPGSPVSQTDPPADPPADYRQQLAPILEVYGDNFAR